MYTYAGNLRKFNALSKLPLPYSAVPILNSCATTKSNVIAVQGCNCMQFRGKLSHDAQRVASLSGVTGPVSKAAPSTSLLRTLESHLALSAKFFNSTD